MMFLKSTLVSLAAVSAILVATPRNSAAGSSGPQSAPVEFGYALCENISFRKPNEASCKQDMQELMKLQKPSYVLVTAEACERFNDANDAVTKAIRAYDCYRKSSQLSGDPGIQGAIRKCSWQSSYFFRHDCLVKKMNRLVKKEINAILKERVQKLLVEKRRETDRAIALRKNKNLPSDIVSDRAEVETAGVSQAR